MDEFKTNQLMQSRILHKNYRKTKKIFCVKVTNMQTVDSSSKAICGDVMLINWFLLRSICRLFFRQYKEIGSSSVNFGREFGFWFKK